MRAGRVLAESAQLWARNLPLLLALVFVVSLPRIGYHVYTVFAPYEDGEPFPDDTSFGNLLSWLVPRMVPQLAIGVVRRVFMYLSQAMVIFAIYNAGGFGASLRGGLRRLVPVVRVALFLAALETVVGVGLFCVALAWQGESLFVSNWPYIYYGLSVLTALVLTPFWIVVPVAVVERTANDLQRSWSLTRGNRLKVFGILLLVYSASAAANWALFMALVELPTFASAVMWWTKDLLFVAFEAVLAVVGYRALRIDKDGIDVTKLEGVFA